jgi:hypothetical protein
LFHSIKERKRVNELGIFREDFEEDVIEESGGVKEAIKDRSGVGN